jgi:hypothetical protein
MSQLKQQKVIGENKNSPVSSVQRSSSSPHLSSPKSANFSFQPVVPSVSETNLDVLASTTNLETDPAIEKSDTHISLNGSSPTSSQNESPVNFGSYVAFARTIGKRDYDFSGTEPNSPMSPVIKTHSQAKGPIEFQGLKYQVQENKKHSTAAQHIPGEVADFSIFFEEIEEIEKNKKVSEETAQLPENNAKENNKDDAIALKLNR